jgi:hypothetical protein
MQCALSRHASQPCAPHLRHVADSEVVLAGGVEGLLPSSADDHAAPGQSWPARSAAKLNPVRGERATCP